MKKQTDNPDYVNLTLVLKETWFNKIMDGEKTEEYREVKPYYISRVFNFVKHKEKPHYITFSLGYSKRKIRVECKAVVALVNNELQFPHVFRSRNGLEKPELNKKWGFPSEEVKYNDFYIFILDPSTIQFP